MEIALPASMLSPLRSLLPLLSAPSTFIERIQQKSSLNCQKICKSNKIFARSFHFTFSQICQRLCWFGTQHLECIRQQHIQAYGPTYSIQIDTQWRGCSLNRLLENFFVEEGGLRRTRSRSMLLNFVYDFYFNFSRQFLSRCVCVRECWLCFLISILSSIFSSRQNDAHMICRVDSMLCWIGFLTR